jgi:tetratricopeptide (TPR) repeat protein
MFLLILTVSNAQKLTVQQVDEQTYNSFSNKDYGTTIILGNEALKQEIDFYYLRYRLGVSYFEKSNYEAAILHFEKAKTLDSNDPVLMEYLYYSYMYTNRNEKAVELLTIFPDDLKAKVNYKSPLFKSISAEVGVLKTDNFDNYKNANLKGTNNFAQGTFYSDVTFCNILITNQIIPNFKIQNLFSLVSNTSNTIFQFSLPIDKSQIFTDKNNYFQWNAIGSYYLKGWNIGAGFGIYSSSSIAYFPPPPFQPDAPFSSTRTTTTNFSGSISLSRKLKYFEPNISLLYSNLSNLNTLAIEGSINYFPLGNLNFYGNTKYGIVTNNTETNTIITQLLGLKISKKLWIEGYGAYGNHQNYISENGLYAFNTPNKINWYAGSNLNFYFKQIDFSIGYGIQERAASYENGPNPSNTNTINYTFNYNLLKTKIVWKF